MDPTPEYLALCNTPPVLLCEAVRTAVSVSRFILAGRAGGAAKRYLFTEPVMRELKKPLEDPRHASVDPGAAEAAAHSRVLQALRAVAEGARAVPDGHSVRESLLRALVEAAAAPDAADYAPGKPRFMEVRAALYAAQGTPLPAPRR